MACKRTRFVLQKDSFYPSKGLVLQAKRTTFLLPLHIFAEIGESHVALLCKSVVEGEGCTQGARLVSLRRNALIVAQQRTIVGVGAVVYYLFGATCRALSAQVGNALLGYDDVHIVLGRVDMAALWHDSAYTSVLGCRRSVEYTD